MVLQGLSRFAAALALLGCATLHLQAATGGQNDVQPSALCLDKPKVHVEGKRLTEPAKNQIARLSKDMLIAGPRFKVLGSNNGQGTASNAAEPPPCAANKIRLLGSKRHPGEHTTRLSVQPAAPGVGVSRGRIKIVPPGDGSAAEYVCVDPGKVETPPPVLLPAMLGIVSHETAGRDRLVRQWCSATVISKRSFITAAHCVDSDFFTSALDSQTEVQGQKVFGVHVQTVSPPGQATPSKAECVAHSSYRSTDEWVRRHRCNQREPGCGADIAVCTLQPDATGSLFAEPSKPVPIDATVEVGARVHLAGFGDNEEDQMRLCSGSTTLVSRGEPGAPGQPAAGLGATHEPAGVFGAAGDSGGGVFLRTGEDKSQYRYTLIGVITQFNFQARATYFVDLRRTDVCNFLLDALSPQKLNDTDPSIQINCAGAR